MPAELGLQEVAAMERETMLVHFASIAVRLITASDQGLPPALGDIEELRSLVLRAQKSLDFTVRGRSDGLRVDRHWYRFNGDWYRLRTAAAREQGCGCPSEDVRVESCPLNGVMPERLDFDMLRPGLRW